MFEQTLYKCPECGTQIRQRIQDKDTLVCVSCRGEFGVLMDEASGRIGLVPLRVTEAVEPLFLPKGSIRSGTAMLLAAASWILVFKGRAIPGHTLSLLLTTIGYYFGFRKKMKSSASRIYDAAAESDEPLFLPPGAVRLFLVAGFVVAGIVLWSRGELMRLDYLEFFTVLAGLIAGHIFARLTEGFVRTRVYEMMNHLKGLAVIACALGLSWLLLSGHDAGRERLCIVLTCLVSFYFGSRS